MTHTPTPWEVDYNKIDKANVRVITGHCKQHVWGCCIAGMYQHGGSEPHGLETDLANAHLMAASPELREVAGLVLDYFSDIPDLEEIVDDMSEDNFLGELIRKALAAARKSSGRNHE